MKLLDNLIMCTVTVDIDEKTLCGVNPNLSSTAAIRNWAQMLINARIQEMVREKEAYALERDMTPEELFSLVADDVRNIYAADATETMSIEEARAMTHAAIREEYAKI